MVGTTIPIGTSFYDENGQLRYSGFVGDKDTLFIQGAVLLNPGDQRPYDLTTWGRSQIQAYAPSRAAGLEEVRPLGRRAIALYLMESANYVPNFQHTTSAGVLYGSGFLGGSNTPISPSPLIPAFSAMPGPGPEGPVPVAKESVASGAPKVALVASGVAVVAAGGLTAWWLLRRAS